MANLTAIQVGKFRPKSARYSKPVFRNLYLTVNPKSSGGSKAWYARYSFGGKRHLLKLGDYELMPYEKAKMRIAQIQLDLKRGDNPKKPKRTETVESYSDDVLPTRERNTTLRSFKNIKGVVYKHIIPAIGHIKLAELTKKNITDFLDDMESNASRK
ncbi:MAG TPA: DUF4102 domain-containing protein [Methylococcaceae bacterium]|jgi:hypothetical protein|nr:DUF4102 domain-containing protein [Methylococcaceae bacterium]HIA45897.1 DUF4102 domain-containing protein [Methylococcaceae bacterium]HIB61898.1 DUF4102 domain-containing protein [Methylococcaceae bacterium]HIN68311.1 DUF4102 domain-containing protein [Methylococcales bacterium]HIO12995.1 DUF4102 domain-containing protein [Methylococcales bacterium]